ncbi:DMT family transporter [Paenibacillus tarimensis]|uniref:DMT family transporter n=1 Tax=Paenibacillus tarimensis TaxID=416012 RepID=UPI001F3107AC|nr:DMT family transporter [Paenibacillus tarimensis]MCF2945340.1 DMT family transporter [Paenibacillus tarimensis]
MSQKPAAYSRAYAAAVSYAIVIGFSFLFVKLALEAAHPVDTLAHRFTIALAAAFIALIAARQRPVLGWKEILAILPLALFYPFLFFTFQTFGLVFTTSSEAGIIHATVPVFTMLLASVFLKERSTWLQKLFTLLTVAGIVSIFVLKGVQFEAASLTGIVLILLSALSSAAYTVLARRLTQRYALLQLTFYMSLIGCIAFNLMAAARHIAEGTLHQYVEPFTHPGYLGAVLYLGVMSSLVSSLLSNYALSIMAATRMSVFNNLSTMITIVTGAVILGEALQAFHYIGAAMVIMGVIGASLSKEKAVRHTRSRR